MIQGNGNLVSGEGNLVISGDDVNVDAIIKNFNTDAIVNQIQSRLGNMGNNMFGNLQSNQYSSLGINPYSSQNYPQSAHSYTTPSSSYQPQSYQNPLNNHINQNTISLQNNPQYTVNQPKPSQIISSPYSSYQSTFNTNPLYPSQDYSYSQGLNTGSRYGSASYGGVPNYYIPSLLNQIGSYQQQYQQAYPQYNPYNYQQPQYNSYQQFSYPLAYQNQGYQQQYNSYSQQNPYQQQVNVQGYQQPVYGGQVKSQNNLRSNDQGSQYQNLGFNLLQNMFNRR